MKRTLNELRKKIKGEVKFIGVKQYSHNIVGLLLSQIDKEFGDAEANKAIEDFGLEDMGWNKVNK